MYFIVMIINLIISISLLLFIFHRKNKSKKIDVLLLLTSAFFIMLILWPTYLRLTIGTQGLPSGTSGFYLVPMVISFYIISLNLLYWFVMNTKQFMQFKIKPIKITSCYSIVLSLIAIFLYGRIGPTGSQIISTIIMLVLIYFAFIKCRLHFLEWNLQKVLPNDSSKYVLIDLDGDSQGIVGGDSKHVIHFIVKLNDGAVAFPESNNNSHYALTNVDFTPRYESYTTTNGRTGRTLLGGALLGIPGAIAGSAGKRRSKTTTFEKSADILLTIINLSNNEKHVIKAIGETKDANLLKTVFLYPKELVHNNTSKTSDENQSKKQQNESLDSDNLRKLKELFDDGIITKEEFEEKKKQILGL
ncbi:SHOCT domain-containing protein [Companilactobacillus farciminis]|nr:SHOCT domain-containing protein [Companilactobacillus farciminis]